MSTDTVTIIIGLGEVGGPLSRILGRTYRCLEVDIQPVDTVDICSVMHVCYPYQIPDFVGTTVAYIRKYRPSLTVINSTVAPGTTRKIYEAAAKPLLAYSPVRGKHTKMEEHMLFYKKFVAGCDDAAAASARRHFASAGFKTDRLPTPEILEASKLLETTYLGVLVAWAQEAERLARRWGATYEEASALWKEVDFLPSNIFPGYIGGHCVMPNIAILRNVVSSRLLDVIVESNQLKAQELKTAAAAGGLL
jgi:UDP-N-acetyl-D-mannosaminuronate dehydrogenase